MVVRDDLISRKAVYEALRQMHGIREAFGLLKTAGRGEGEMLDRDKVEYLLEEFDPAPHIEAIIKKFSVSTGMLYNEGEIADLFRWSQGQKQNTWTDKRLGFPKHP